MPITDAECKGFVSKLMPNTAWVRLNFTQNAFTDEQLRYMAVNILQATLPEKGRAKEASAAWEVTKAKYAEPLGNDLLTTMNTVLMYIKKVKDS